MVINIADEAEQRHNRNICIALIENFIRIVRNQYAGLKAEPREITDILPDDRRVYVDRADNLCAVLMQIPKNVLAHFAAAILHNSDFFHKNFLL